MLSKVNMIKENILHDISSGRLKQRWDEMEEMCLDWVLNNTKKPFKRKLKTELMIG